MRYLGVIPARAGSKRIPRKNVKPLGGIPLIGHTIRAAQQSNRLTDFVVSTESREIAKVAREDYGVPVHPRDPALARDETTSTEVMLAVMKDYDYRGIFGFGDMKGTDFDAIVCLHPTSPFRTGKHIDEAIEEYERGLAQQAFSEFPYCGLASAYRIPNKPHLQFYDAKGHRDGTARCVGGIQLAMLNAAIYITPANEDALSIPIQTVDRLYFMDQRSSIDIDTPLDWIMAEAAMENGH